MLNNSGIEVTGGEFAYRELIPIGMVLLSYYAKQGKLPPKEAENYVWPCFTCDVFFGADARTAKYVRIFNRWYDKTLRENGFPYKLFCAHRKIYGEERCVPIESLEDDSKLDRQIEKGTKIFYTYYWEPAGARGIAGKNG